MKGFDSADIIAKEAKRLEVVKRRQERELAQMVEFEMLRKELQVNCTFYQSTAYAAKELQ